MTRDPFGTLRAALWLGGAQWAGKSTVANLLAHRYGITAYHHDYHDSRSHEDRRRARGVPELDPEDRWVRGTPEELAAAQLASFPLTFEFILDDLRPLVSGRPILAEGWGLRPDLVASIVDSMDRMLVMVPTEAFRERQLSTLDRAGPLPITFSDPDRAQRNRIARDRIIAADCRLGVRVIEVDGFRDAEAVADLAAEHFVRYLG